VTDRLREKLPKLAAMMDGAEHEVPTFMDFPKEHRVKIHSAAGDAGQPLCLP